MNALKPRKGFVQDELNIERLTPIQWDGIMRAMQNYAKHYHETMQANDFEKPQEQCTIPVVNGWHTLEIEPPDEMVEVEDKNGNRARAIPTYYPFKLGENKTGRKRGSEVIHCSPYWDGGWMIQCEGLTSNIDSDIVRWRACR